jgi:hypothetical protein
VQERVVVGERDVLADGDRDEIGDELLVLLRDLRGLGARWFLEPDDVDDRFGVRRLAIGVRDRDLADDATRTTRIRGRRDREQCEQLQNAMPQLSFGASRM